MPVSPWCCVLSTAAQSVMPNGMLEICMSLAHDGSALGLFAGNDVNQDLSERQPVAVARERAACWNGAGSRANVPVSRFGGLFPCAVFGSTSKVTLNQLGPMRSRVLKRMSLQRKPQR